MRKSALSSFILFTVLGLLPAGLRAQVVVRVNTRMTYQTMSGFGLFGGAIDNWVQKTSPGLATQLVDDLGITINRGSVPFDFEPKDLSLTGADGNIANYNLTGDVSKEIPVWKGYHARGLSTFILSVWSPPPWMKNPGAHGHDAQPWCKDGRAGGELLPENYPKFARMLVVFLKYFKSQVGVDAYAISLQNELAFDEPYESCVYTPQQYVALLKVVGPEFRRDGIKTKIFFPEDIGYYDRVMSYINGVMDDAQARQYPGIVAIHAYDTNGVTPNSPSAKTWENMFAPGAKHGLPFWMTETSGYGLDWPAAMNLARSMYVGLRYGHVSAWVMWEASTVPKADNESLTGGLDGKDTPPKYFAAKQFYRFIRPGSVCIEANADDDAVLPLAFTNTKDRTMTLVLINTSTDEKKVTLNISGSYSAPASFQASRSSETESCLTLPPQKRRDSVTLSPMSITTLQGKTGL
jgi:glucuronoarabinoxylan endo-1,4-beta-xylanase